MAEPAADEPLDPVVPQAADLDFGASNALPRASKGKSS